eukprot:TRINITY_DN7309_c0_g1_i1.p1 TRINITY_DN7309_c0_g1~~TRINITY_DN7309_c0_g1_i1.p1  ORF type:complete len:884 (+),score=204.89 TRINITY_DN7309_c0_g1_i1:48-2699(+)
MHTLLRRGSTVKPDGSAGVRLDLIFMSAGWTLLGVGLVLYASTVLLSVEMLYNVISYCCVILSVMGVAAGLGGELLLMKIDRINNDLHSMSWIVFENEQLTTTKATLSQFQELRDVELSILTLVKNIIQVRPYLPTVENDFSSIEEDTKSDFSSSEEEDTESDSEFPEPNTAASSPCASPKPIIRIDSMFRATTDPHSAPKIRFDVGNEDLTKKAFDFTNARKRLSLPGGVASRRQSVSDTFVAYHRRSSMAGYNFGRRKSSCASDYEPDKTDSAAVLKLNSKLRNTMRKGKGTIISVEFGLLELVNDSTEGTYHLAEILVSNVLDIVKNNNGTILQIRADGVIASWNTHQPCSLHAWSACRSALEIKESMESVEENERVGWSVAITGGILYSGNIGNDHHKAQFILGDKVDKARYMNQLSRVLQTPILLTEAVQEMTTDEIKSRPIDIISWGTQEECRTEMIFELLSESDTKDVGTWKQAFSAFIGDHHEKALELLSALDDKDEQVDRFTALVKSATDNSGLVPKPYSRKLDGWQVWEVSDDQSPQSLVTGTGTSVGSRQSLYSVESLSKNKKLSWDGFGTKRQNSQEHAELLKIAIEQDVPPDDFDSDSDDYDTPPTFFIDKDGCKWRRSDKKLGEGAFGEVWLGMSGEGSLVALKCIKMENQPVVKKNRFGRSGQGQSETLTSAINEVDVLSKYKDDSIVSFISCGVYDRHIIVAMEYVSGGSLASVISSFGSIPTNSAKRYTRDILKGLIYLHSKNIVHRDLKPANVLLHTDGQCKLSDFGTSALSDMVTDTRTIGTPLFMAPEACNGKACKASDVWSLGHTVIEMLTSQTPFEYALDVPKQQHCFMRWLCQTEGDIPLPAESSLGTEASALVAKVLIR